jgi:microcystin-dependent protein
MKIKIVIVDFAISPKVKRWVLRLGIPAGIILVGGLALAASSVHVWSKNDPLTADDLNSSFQAVATPPGTIVAYGGGTPPAGWLSCDGSVISRTTYATLFAAISINFGGGDGVSTFNIPDLRGRFLRGVDATGTNDPGAALRTAIAVGGNTGAKVGTLQAGATALPITPFVTDTFPDHTHTASNGANFVTQGAGGVQTGGNALSAVATTAPAGAHKHVVTTGGDSETRPVNVAMNYIIKL